MKTKKIAKRIDEFTPDRAETFMGHLWIFVSYTQGEDLNSYPKIVQYDGRRFYRMGHNSDHMEIGYKEAKGKPFHLRYMD